MFGDSSIHEAVQFAVATEAMASHAYTWLAKEFSTEKELSEAFTLLAADEKAHGVQFKTLLDKLPPNDEAPLDDEDRQYLNAMARSEFFRGNTGLATLLSKTESLDEALSRVLDFEKATLGFYQAIRDLLGQEETLDTIIAAEKQHIIRLMKYILTDEKMKGLGDEY
jgi:rubrerythrin